MARRADSLTLNDLVTVLSGLLNIRPKLILALALFYFPMLRSQLGIPFRVILLSLGSSRFSDNSQLGMCVQRHTAHIFQLNRNMLHSQFVEPSFKLPSNFSRLVFPFRVQASVHACNRDVRTDPPDVEVVNV